MAYQRTVWKDLRAGGTLATAARFNNMEEGIVSAHELASSRVRQIRVDGVAHDPVDGVVDLPSSSAELPPGGADGQVLTWSEEQGWVPAAPPSSGGGDVVPSGTSAEVDAYYATGA